MPEINQEQQERKTQQITDKEIEKIIEGARNDIKNIEGFVLGQLKNQIIKDKKPIDINTDDFKKAFKGTFEADPNETSIVEINGKKEVIKNNVINVPATIAAINEKIEDAVKKGASSDKFKELKQEMTSFSNEFREAFKSNEKINNLIKDRFKSEIVTESVPFLNVENNEPIQLNLQNKKELVDNLYRNIEIPDELYKEIVINKNNVLKEDLINNIIGPEIKKAFGRPPTILTNSDGENYEVATLDEEKLKNPENIKNFHEVLNDNIKKYLAAGPILEDLKKTDPSLTATQTKQYQDALYKLDTKYLKENINQVSDSLKHLHETTKLSIFEKIVTTIKGEDKEAYLAKKVGKLAVRAFINKPNQDINSKPIIDRVNTNVALSQPYKNLSEAKKIQETYKNYVDNKSSIATPSKTPTHTSKLANNKTNKNNSLGI